VAAAMHDWPHWLWYELFYWASRVFFTFAFSLREEGRRNVPPKGPVLLIANHQSFVDPLLVGLAARRHLCQLARKTLYKHRLFGAFLHTVNTVPVDQHGFAKEGLQRILERLQEGEAVVVYPEGERTWTGAVQPLKPGIHLLIKRAGVPIVPVGIAGAYEALPRTRKWPILSPLLLPATGTGLAVVVGKPILPERFLDVPREFVLQELFEELKVVQQRAERIRRKS
jgi:1-acyl-sn-glycerol-3-phosphate acyltransferase